MEFSSETALYNYVLWPSEMRGKGTEVRSIFDRVHRFVDFDGTIVGHGGVPRATLMGKPTKEFLAEEAYVVQTWNHEMAIAFFEQMQPDFPKPLLIIVPESIIPSKDGSDDVFVGKNFAALGLTGKLIIDDALDCEIHAPGCEVVFPE